tara:strand:+ start:1905 stop:2816 length:912 start_codon:yes stop_codon:yes gene_type:complete
MQDAEKVEATEESVQEPTEVVELDEEVTESKETESAPIEDISAEESAKYKEEDELEDYSKNVQKRIATLTKKMREQERAANSAYEYAKNLQAENEQLRKSSSELKTNYQTEAESRLKSQRAQANAVLKSAYQDQDWDKVTKAQDILDKINIEESKLANTKIIPETQNQAPPVQPQDMNRQQMQKAVDPKAEEWANKNEWFGTDKVMTTAAFTIHDILTNEEGIDANNPMYYSELDKRIRNEFPHKFEDDVETTTKPKVQQTVAPAGRSESSGRKKQVKLTKSEVEMARRLNVPLKEYAKHIRR